MKRAFWVLTYLVFAVCAYSQTAADSLKASLDKAEGEDRLQIYLDLINYYFDDDNNTAELYSDTLLTQAEKQKSDFFLATGYLKKGLCHYYKGKYELAANCYEKAYDLAKKLQHSNLMYLSTNNLGNIYDVYGDSDVAEKYYREAIVYAKQHGNMENLAITYVNLGNIYCYDSFPLMQVYYDSALNITSDPSTEIVISSNLAYLYYENGRYDEANEKYNYVLSLIDKTADSYLYATILNHISDLNICKKEYDLAAKNLKIVDSI
ncbi:MAG: tetratricopeptide repeat protein, partial [Bacteroidales bacterium]|nr:tetratricopeptide repeat protein [Bacteroidales bacterium]